MINSDQLLLRLERRCLEVEDLLRDEWKQLLLRLALFIEPILFRTALIPLGLEILIPGVEQSNFLIISCD